LQSDNDIKETYNSAGVDINGATKAMSLIGKLVRSTHRAEVLSGLGSFGGLFEIKGYNEPVLVSSVDGVGTKLRIATALNRHDTIGIDLVNHCVNDIFTCGAEPLFFLDYIATGSLVPEQIEDIVKGLSQACKEVGCALIGGETAEMPGIYHGDDYDLAGFIVGVVEKGSIIKGDKIVAGDSIIGLPSSGLHTNGYSLVRKIFGETESEMTVSYPELEKNLGETLLEPHRCYFNLLKPLLSNIKGMAHITGGGLIDNVPRILPQGLTARFDSQKWTVPPVFNLIQQRGNVDRNEMYRVFNMGIGMVVFCSESDVDGFLRKLPDALVVGKVIQHDGETRVIID